VSAVLCDTPLVLRLLSLSSVSAPLATLGDSVAHDMLVHLVVMAVPTTVSLLTVPRCSRNQPLEVNHELVADEFFPRQDGRHGLRRPVQ